jgi:carboxyl-terminal processing protease
MKKALFLLITFFSVKAGHAQLADSLKSHLDSAIAILQKHSLYAARVNWVEVKALAYRDAATAQNKQQLFKPIANVYSRLNDHHGWFEQYNDKLQLIDSSAIKRYTPSLLEEWAKGPKIKTGFIDDVAYLRIPGIYAFNQKQVDKAAGELVDSIRSLASKRPKAWIIDVRMNTGGNILPMMTALGVFFKDGVVSYYLDRDRKPVSTSVIKKGVFYLDTLKSNVTIDLPGLANAKVAMIIGPGTASSGEGVATIFKERPHTRLIGEPTAGVANATEGFIFNNNNSYFLITTATLGNSKMEPMAQFVMPDQYVKNNNLFTNITHDNAIHAAFLWIR